eukprot:CAMPEP_0118682268 /NCGR_PEP_ID=MMETSP0800-20121206/5396_1 /TAXON_ID=210618 ORGANISM="Striatella unipunctata, Strain CCMP2910" /NCGR_SAMPLE_ID=MMETSP0800 /ASSEMBLY_ACC=CAM_ASM_000638 /LENGTH=361 /DNA_ID=CAMNT_0006578649 /DNA_START=41 /DNA_END=1127 /DNA_ORIENTATION=-
MVVSTKPPPSSSSVQTKEHMDITKKYELLETLGEGTFGVVRKGRNRKTGELFAIKTILKSRVPNLSLLKKEVDILSHVDHPHIIKLYETFEQETKIHLVTEFCSGGELYDRVVEKTQSPEHHFHEYDAARILRNMLEAISYCHDVKHVAHRDLKVENFLLQHEGDDAPVKIIDFGLSRFNPNNVMHSRVGTAYYVAPEVLLSDHYTNKCDIWSIGVIAYVLLCGFPPFYADSEYETLQLVKQAKVEFPSPTWDDITDDAKRFIMRLLQPDPNERPSARQILDHDPWLENKHVQPAGTTRAATFLPRQSRRNKQQQQQQQQQSHTTTTTTMQRPEESSSVRSVRMKHPKQKLFHRFLVKLRK